MGYLSAIFPASAIMCTNSTMEIMNSNLHNIYSRSGSVVASFCNITCHNTSFLHTYSETGPGNFRVEYSNLAIFNSLIFNDSTTAGGTSSILAQYSVLSISSTNFSKNTASVRAYQTLAVIDTCKFEDSAVQYAVYCLTATCTISNCEFSNNLFGGLQALNSNLEFYNSLLYNNKGSAAALIACTIANITNTTFISNTATSDGGAIQVSGNCITPTRLEIRDSVMLNNSSINGGAVGTNNQNKNRPNVVIFNYVTCSRNQAQQLRGCFYIVNNDRAEFISSFINVNRAIGGGRISLVGNSSATLQATTVNLNMAGTNKIIF